jgi:hypothetical protein
MLGEGVTADGYVGRVFMSYRREDSSGYANALQAKLEKRFGAAAIVRDLADVRPGIDFDRFISQTVPKCSVLLALIGPRWLGAIDKDGRRRLEQEGDFVRAEIAQALQQKHLLVIPVLVGGACMPPESSLPLDISALSRRNAVELSDARWDHDVNGLVDAIQDDLRERGLDVSDAYLRTLKRRFEEAGFECRTNMQHGRHRFDLIANGSSRNLRMHPVLPIALFHLGVLPLSLADSPTFFSIPSTLTWRRTGSVTSSRIPSICIRESTDGSSPVWIHE